MKVRLCGLRCERFRGEVAVISFVDYVCKNVDRKEE